MKKEEKKGLETLKEGTIVTIYFKNGFGRPKKQRFKLTNCTSIISSYYQKVRNRWIIIP